MKVTYYDYSFNQNEWFVLITIIVSHIIIFMLPKRYPILLSITLYLYGLTMGIMFDNTIGAHIFDFYDIGDSSAYDLMDIATYVMYGPMSYIFIYIQDKFKIHGKLLTTYILLWSLVAFGVEALATYLGLFHYKNGYQIYYSFPIYIGLFGVLYLIYSYIKDNRSCN